MAEYTQLILAYDYNYENRNAFYSLINNLVKGITFSRSSSGFIINPVLTEVCQASLFNSRGYSEIVSALSDVSWDYPEKVILLVRFETEIRFQEVSLWQKFQYG